MRSALGKGLDALISEDTAASVSAPVTSLTATRLPLSRLQANPHQPRQAFDETKLNELADSIKEKGILQPILVALKADGNYEIVAGERRWRAAQKAGLTEVPVTVTDADEKERFALALIENIQREDLNPVEQAEGYRHLQDDFSWTQEKIAQTVGKNRAVVANSLRLLHLPEAIRAAMIDGKISAGHGRALVAVEDPAAQQALFQRILAENLPVRNVEDAARAHKQTSVREHLRTSGDDGRAPEIKTIEEDLQRALTRKVELRPTGKTSQKGWIRLEFYSLEDLDALIAQLKRQAAQ